MRSGHAGGKCSGVKTKPQKTNNKTQSQEQKALGFSFLVLEIWNLVLFLGSCDLVLVASFWLSYIHRLQFLKHPHCNDR